MAKKNHIIPNSSFGQMEAALRELKSARKAALKKKKIDITLDQWAVIESISKAERANQSYLASATHKDPAAITRMIDLMIRKGIVQRKEEKGDKRAYHVKLTRKGAGLVKRVTPLIEKVNKAALAEVSDRDLSAVKRITAKMIAGVSA